MSLLSDAEIRYTSISMIALVIITRVLNFMALRDSAFTPAERAGKTVEAPFRVENNRKARSKFRNSAKGNRRGD